MCYDHTHRPLKRFYDIFFFVSPGKTVLVAKEQFNRKSYILHQDITAASKGIHSCTNINTVHGEKKTVIRLRCLLA